MRINNKFLRRTILPIIIEFSFLISDIRYIKVILDLIVTKFKITIKKINIKSESIYIKNNKKKAIIVTFGSVYSAKLESLLAIGLRKRGWDISVLMPHRGLILKLYFKAFGFNKFIYRNEVTLEEHEIFECIKYQHDIANTKLSFDVVKKWQFKGISIGPTLLSSVQRQNRLSSPDLNNEKTKNEILEKLPKILEWVIASNNIIENEKPDLIYLIEANDWNKPIVESCIRQNVQVIQLVQPFRDDALIFKRLNSENIGTNPNSLDKKNLDLVVNREFGHIYEERLEKEFQDRYSGIWFMQNRNQPSNRRVAKEELVSELGLIPNLKIAVIFSHILWDANLFYGEDIYNDYSEWFVKTVKLAIKNREVNWILKLHPANIWKRSFENESGELAEISLLKLNGLYPLPEHIKLMYPDANISTLSLYNSIDYGITVRGTVGMELPALGILTLTCGTGRYSNLGFTLDSKTRAEYEEFILNIHKLEGMNENKIRMAKWHAYMIFCARIWRFNSFKFTHGALKNFNALAYNIKLVSNPYEKNNDIEKWVDWVDGDPKQCDYIDYKSLSGVNI